MGDDTASGRDADDVKPVEAKGSKAGASHSTAGKGGVAKPASKAKLAAREEAGTPRPRSAKVQKADEVQASGSAKAGGPHAGESVTEGGQAPAPTQGKGVAKPAASKAANEGRPEDGTSGATVGRAEKAEAAGIASTRTASGRGRRKAGADASE